MILRSFMGAINPFFCSSKSFLSANGSLALCLLEHLHRECRGRLALGMKVSLQRGWLLGACGALVQNQVTGYGESGPRRRKGLHELSSGCHCVFLTRRFGKMRPLAHC